MADRHPNWKPLHERAWNGRAAAEYGCTVTFENDGGQVLVLARKGPPRDVLRALCDAALAVDPSFRVVCYSTPETIRQDLMGRYNHEVSARTNRSLATPENRALGQAGLLHLLHPRMRGSDPHAHRKYRALDAREGR